MTGRRRANQLRLWLAPVALLPIAALGLWLWRDQATPIWLAGFIAACF